MSMIPMIQQGDIIPRSPSSQLRLYSGVPWDNRYEHVRLYSNTSDLLSHLETWRVTPSSQLNNLTPIHVGDYEVRVPFTEMSALKINYAAFQNTGISTEWVFCFVTDIKWRSENTTILTLELDYWQNNIYFASLNDCFIERMHIPKSEDIKYTNLLPESFETGEYIQYSEENSDWGDFYLCIYASEKVTDTQWTAYTPSITGNIMMCVGLINDPLTTEGLAGDIETLLNMYTDAGKIDSILNIITAPKLCVDQWGNNIPVSASKSLSLGSPFEGYEPKNNKLYQYPYCFLRIDNNLGESNTYRWEYFNLDSPDTDAGFTEECLMCTLPTVTCSPVQYKGSLINYGESLLYNNFPTSAWCSDTLRAWFAQNKGTIIMEGVNAVSGLATGLAASGPTSLMGDYSPAIASVGNAVNKIGGLLNEVYQHAIQPPTMHGKVMQEAVNAGLDRMCFTYRKMSITKNFAKSIDDFWTAFGYPIREIRTPDYTNRSVWNYIKTVNCNTQGQIDFNARQRLNEIFDSGVTVWHTDDVGNYSLTNN